MLLADEGGGVDVGRPATGRMLDASAGRSFWGPTAELKERRWKEVIETGLLLTAAVTLLRDSEQRFLVGG